MKIHPLISKSLIGVALIFFELSCQPKTGFVDLMDIKKGMTKQEVSDLIGAPTGKGDDGNRWHHGKESNVVLFTDGVVSSIVLDYSGEFEAGGAVPVDEMFPYQVDEKLTVGKTNIKVTVNEAVVDTITNSIATLEDNGQVCIRVDSDKAGYDIMLFLDPEGKYEGRVCIYNPLAERDTASFASAHYEDLTEIRKISVNTKAFAIGDTVVVKFLHEDIASHELPIVLDGVLVVRLQEPFYRPH